MVITNNMLNFHLQNFTAFGEQIETVNQDPPLKATKMETNHEKPKEKSLKKKYMCDKSKDKELTGSKYQLQWFHINSSGYPSFSRFCQ